MRIYLDNAATTPLEKAVLDVMIPFWTNHFGNPSATYSEGRTARAAIERARKEIATLLSCHTSELFFTSGGTEANNTALKCAVNDLGVTRIISTTIEHACVRQSIATLEECTKTRLAVEHVRFDETGRADLNHLEELLQDTSQKTLVSLMHANNEIGTLNPIDEIANLCERYGAYFHTDTVQSIGHFPMSLKNSKIHFLSASAHKLHGPKGVGFLYVNKKNSIQGLIHGGGQERKMRSGTENVAGIIGFAKALEIAHQKMEEHRAHIENLRNYFIQSLQENIPGVRFNGDYKGKYLYTVLSVAIPTDVPLNMLLFQLDLKGVSVSGGSACSSGSVQGSHVIQQLGVDIAYKTIRFSFSHQNTLSQIKGTCQILFGIVKKKAVVSV